MTSAAHMAKIFIAFTIAIAIAPQALAAPPCEEKSCFTTWLGMAPKTQQAVTALSEDYKRFMHKARTELATVTETEKLVKAAGFKPWRPGAALTPGARYYDINRHRSITLIVIGEQPISQGVRISASHIDSPRIELKGRPVYEREGFALFQTNYHGGIKNYQWGNIPLALLGRIDKKDGTTVEISVGLEPGDPVFVIADLSPHVDIDLRERKNRNVLEAEELDPIIGHREKSQDQGVKEMVAEYLQKTHGIGLDDLASAELALVPTFPPADVGFDRSLMGIYGQDDRLSAFASIRAAIELKTPPASVVVYLADNEEAGNRNNTGAESNYLEDLIAELLYAELGDAYREPLLKRTLRNTRVVSTDVNPGINPHWPNAWEGGNAPRLGHGVNLKIYGQGNNANSEYAAWIRAVLDDAGIPWQTATYKVGKGGGGTLGGELSNRNMEVIDFGVPVLSIHTTYAVSSKADLYWLYLANKAFFERQKQ